MAATGADEDTFVTVSLTCDELPRSKASARRKTRIAIRVGGIRPFGLAKDASIGERGGILNRAIECCKEEICMQSVSSNAFVPGNRVQKECGSLMMFFAVADVEV